MLPEPAPAGTCLLFALSEAAAIVTGALGLAFHALATLASQAWPAASCPLCQQGVPRSSPVPD